MSKAGDPEEIEIVENSGETDFCSQINLGIKNCNTEWFSIFEVDDEYKKTWTIKQARNMNSEYSASFRYAKPNQQ